MSLPPPGVKRKPGKKRLPEHRRRVLISTRVLPSTAQFLESIGEKNIGRSLDRLAQRLAEQNQKNQPTFKQALPVTIIGG